MRLDIEFEEQILARALRDVDYLRRASKVLDAHHYGTPQHAWVWKVIQDTWNTYREQCSPKYVVARAKRDYPKDEDREPYLELAKKLFRIKPSFSSSALDELALFVRTVNAQLALEKGARALEKDKLDEVYEVMRMVGQRDLRTIAYTHVKWIEEFEQRQAERKYRREHPDEFVSIPTGFKRLDEILGGGIQKGEVGLILGTTGRGKSVMTNNLAQVGIQRGYKGVIFGFEMPARQIAMRQDARWLKMPYKKFKEYDFRPDELRDIAKRLKRIHKRHENKLHILSMPIRSATLGVVRSALDDLWLEHKFKPDFVVFDSLDHVLPDSKAESNRLDQANIYWAAKGMAEDMGIAIWSTTQAGKEYVKQLITAEATSESYDKARIADMIITINEPFKRTRATKVVDDEADDSEDDVDEAGGISPEISVRGKYLELYLAKYRDGASAITIPLDAELDKMLIQEAGLSSADDDAPAPTMDDEEAA